MPTVIPDRIEDAVDDKIDHLKPSLCMIALLFVVSDERFEEIITGVLRDGKLADLRQTLTNTADELRDFIKIIEGVEAQLDRLDSPSGKPRH